MASAMASAAAHSIPPPYAIPVGPRVRPPRLLPGTKAANTNPQPEGPPPERNQVWVQGKWRNVNSNAVKDRRVVQSRQTEKALRHATHGLDIYAYTHIRTNQVVYSLSRVMQNNKILPQLIFHGKQTVPSALRRDTWKPYFSLHFSRTPAGAQAGLKAYQRLRELATWRQLSPPADFLIATEQDVEKAKSKYNPIETKRHLKAHSLKNLPIKNQRLPKRLRAIKLMDQKASSVADAAYVLNFLNDDRSPAEQLELSARAKEDKLKGMSTRATRRLNKIREKELVKATQLESRQELVWTKEGQLGLTKHAAERIAIEYGGAIVGDNMVTDLEAIRQSKQAATDYLSLRGTGETPSGQLSDTDPVTEPVPEEASKKQNDDSRVVEILWADIRDAAYAKQWSRNVYHGELEPRAVVKQQHTIIRQEAIVDEDGQEISEQRQKVLAQDSSTPHIFGRVTGSGWYQSPEQLSKDIHQGRQTKLEEWQDLRIQKSKEILTQIEALRSEQDELLQRKREIEPEYRALQSSEAADSVQPIMIEEARVIEQLTESEKEELRESMSKIEQSLAANENKLAELQESYPGLYERASDLNVWRQGRNDYMEMLKAGEDLRQIEPLYEWADLEARSKMEQIDTLLATYVSDVDGLEGVENTEPELMMRTQKRDQEIGQLQQRLDSLKNEANTTQNEVLVGETIDNITNLKRLTSTERHQVWENRERQIDRVLERWAEVYPDLRHLLVQRIHAERSGDAERIQGVDAELKTQEAARIEDQLGLRAAANKTEDTSYELDESMREKGMELPPPKRENRGIWGRVKGLFGR